MRGARALHGTSTCSATARGTRQAGCGSEPAQAQVPPLVLRSVPETGRDFGLAPGKRVGGS
eukprot:1048064-Alexandrium_andersonii.AAC.1